MVKIDLIIHSNFKELSLKMSWICFRTI